MTLFDVSSNVLFFPDEHERCLFNDSYERFLTARFVFAALMFPLGMAMLVVDPSLVQNKKSYPSRSLLLAANPPD